MHLSRPIFISVLLATAFSAGCAGTPSISSWRQSVERYVKTEGNGEALALRDVKLPDGQRGFSIIGQPNRADSTDVNGVLVAHRTIDGRPWFVYLVGEVQQNKVRDIRLAALSIEAGRFDWRISPQNSSALAAYAQASPTFPALGDEFALSESNDVVEVSNPRSGARWRVKLSK